MRRRQRLKNRFEMIDNSFFTADHQAIAFLQSPDSATGPCVNKMDAVRLESFRSPEGILVFGIAAVNQNVALRKVWQQLFDGLIDRISRGHHQPNRPWQRQLFDKISQRTGAERAFIDNPLDRLGVTIEADHPMPTED